jgi:threonylcarbamoyladenosine tRNA methylthiotransferase MtaB
MYTLGCKLNFAETSTIGRQFEQAGFTIVPFETGADVCVINTCSVTENADKKCKKIVKDALKANPSAFIAIVGCYAQLKPQEIAQIKGVDVVLGAAEKFQLLNYIEEGFAKKQQAIVKNTEIKEVQHFEASYSFGQRTRTFLKVQDGCDYSCSFCTIPLARGESRSDSIENIVKAAQEIAASGVKEIVLTGVNIGDYAKYEKDGFLRLIQALDEVEGIERFRISSIEPNLLSNDIIAFVAKSKRFMPHFHIPLQSGNDKMLALMRRRYKSGLYADRVAEIKRLMPHACIGVDVIVGFPGESKEDFLITYNFLNQLDVSYLHVFTYSERPNTHAITLPDVVSASDRAERSKMLHILSDKKKHAFYKQFLTSELNVLWEGEKKGEHMFGFTDNYIKVAALANEALENQITSFIPNQINEDLICEGELKLEFSA